jgi:DNA-binding GntR family transcriptional regulator
MRAEPPGSSSDAYLAPSPENAWSAEAAGLGRTGTQRLLNVGTTEPPEEVRDGLSLEPGDQVVCRSRLIMLDDRPVEIAASYYPAVIAAGSPLAGPGKIRGGAVATLTDLGFTAADVVERITARLPTTEEADLLQIAAHEPLLVLARTSHDPNGRAFEHAVNRMVARLTAPVVYRMRTLQV